VPGLRLRRVEPHRDDSALAPTIAKVTFTVSWEREQRDLKNLNRIFERAGRHEAVLLFDASPCMGRL